MKIAIIVIAVLLAFTGTFFYGVHVGKTEERKRILSASNEALLNGVKIYEKYSQVPVYNGYTDMCK